MKSMRGKLFYSFLVFLLFSSVAFAQNKPIKFQSIEQFGIAGGKSEVNSVFQSVNGIKFSKWFTGIGIGLDNYEYTTLPFFIDGRRYFGNQNRGFVYFDAGYNFPWDDKLGNEISYTSYYFTGGIYTDVGIGYQFQFLQNRNSSFLFSLGYSYKRLETETESESMVMVMCNPCDYIDYSNKYVFSYGRIMLNLGLVF